MIGGERVYDEFKDAVRIFALRDEIRALLAEAPVAVVNPSGAAALLMPLLEDFARGRIRGADDARDGAPADRATDDAGFREHLTYGLAALQHRFADPMRLLALAVAAAGSDEVARLERSPYGAAVDLALAEIDRAVQRLAHVLSAKGDPAGALKRFHGMTRALSTTLDLAVPSACRTRLTELRALASDLVAAEIEHAPALIRRALDPVDSRTQRVSGFDRIEAEHAVFAARLFTAARLGADALWPSTTSSRGSGRPSNAPSRLRTSTCRISRAAPTGSWPRKPSGACLSPWTWRPPSSARTMRPSCGGASRPRSRTSPRPADPEPAAPYVLLPSDTMPLSR